MLISVENIPAHKINREKWDACVDAAPNGLIYSRSVYLDAMCDNWNGIVLNDYETVMALPWRKKYGIKYIYDVPFIQQLGWIGEVDEKLAKPFVKALLNFCRYGTYAFNFLNNITENTSRGKQSNNYVLPLTQQYEQLQSNYKTDLNNNLKKANKFQLQYNSDKADTAIQVYKELYKHKLSNAGALDFMNFQMLCKQLSNEHMILVRSVRDKNDEVLSIALFLKHKKHLYNIMNSTTVEGRKTEANAFLFDSLIHEFAGRDLILNFEGSDIPGVKGFYEKFGTINQPYTRIKFNNLPLPVRLFKR